jgi:hypothetical protein
LLRHAEEPSDPQDPDLSAAGRRRAVRLAAYIPLHFASPCHLISAAANKSSARAFLTLRPLSLKLDVPIDTSFRSIQCKTLAETLRSDAQYRGQSIAVCWTHRELPAVAKALGASVGEYPDPWDEIVFDLILRFCYGKRGKVRVDTVRQPF